MDASDISLAVDELVALRRQPGRIDALPDQCRPASEAEAYAIQDALAPALSEAGRGPVAGYKIGCTSPVMQELLDVDHPCSGRVHANDIHLGDTKFSFGDFYHPGVECEIAVRLGAALPARTTPYSQDEVADAVAACMASIEVVDARFADMEKTDAIVMVADDFYNAACVLGGEVSDWRSLDLANLTGRMIVNGEERGRGEGSAILGHPLAALEWLANHLSGRGLGLAAGDIVTLGSVVQTQWLEPGDVAQIEFDGLGSVTASFET